MEGRGRRETTSLSLYLSLRVTELTDGRKTRRSRGAHDRELTVVPHAHGIDGTQVSCVARDRGRAATSLAGTLSLRLAETKEERWREECRDGGSRNSEPTTCPSRSLASTRCGGETSWQIHNATIASWLSSRELRRCATKRDASTDRPSGRYASLREPVVT